MRGIVGDEPAERPEEDFIRSAAESSGDEAVREFVKDESGRPEQHAEGAKLNGKRFIPIEENDGENKNDERRLRAEADAEESEHRHGAADDPRKWIGGRAAAITVMRSIIPGHTWSPSRAVAVELVEQQERGDGLRVDDLGGTDHLDGFIERRGHYLDLLVFFQCGGFLFQIVGSEGI
jgi:hypothetical protein